MRHAARMVAHAAQGADRARMSEAHPVRYRQRLILVASLDEDGLEDLTYRLVLPDFPEAHRTARARDAGMDVISDRATPPERAWQAKNFVDTRINWDACRDSLRSAMASRHPPSHYTFVFPRALRLSEYEYWRDTFEPEMRAEFPDSRKLDYWDDLAMRLEPRPELVDRLSDGALAGYMRNVFEQTAATGVNPLAGAPDLAGDADAMADHAKRVGANDPYFVYGHTGREAGASDRDHADRHVRFTLNREKEDALPRYKVAIRVGDKIKELTAEPREGASPSGPEPWFSPDEAGDELRHRARISLAKGRAISLEGPAAGLHPGDVPDRFISMADEQGLLRDGELELGVSVPCRWS